MSIRSSNGEVFGSAVLYGAIVVMSLILPLASVSSLPPVTAAPAWHAADYTAVETVVVTGKAGKVS